MDTAAAWTSSDSLGVSRGQTDPFSAAILASRMPMIVTDPRQDDNPIVFANDAFLDMTGYGRDEVEGRNCRFLQGQETDRLGVAAIRRAIERGQDIAIDILNYRKDGSSFWNALYICPLFDADGEVQYFVASQADASQRKRQEQETARLNEELERQVRERTSELQEALAASRRLLEQFDISVRTRTRELEDALATSNLLLHEVDHRVKNNLQMVSAMLMLQAMSIPDRAIRDTLQEMLERIEAMALVHKRLYQSDSVFDFDLGAFTGEIAFNLVAATGRTDIELVTELDSVKIRADDAACIALVVNELITNALKHAFANGRGGRLTIRVTAQGERCEISVCDDGMGLAEHRGRDSGFGKSLVETLILQLHAEIEWSPALPGTCVTVVLPLA